MHDRVDTPCGVRSVSGRFRFNRAMVESSQDTIEERIKELQRRKLDLAENILSKNGSRIGLDANSKLSLQDLKLLFGVGGASVQGKHTTST